ncbi:MAG TPA: biotin--[acetyl-CoA-carboxylase] ligase [Victivallales bacterium]|nr:biotin--[acetyl-CoA-carboxylase] ligase [Victivallales bacterium]HRR28722.1 biotin--[acetyl-CoA-carboxylase] ligase [Victivallales bacterium]HRU01925.1 biotin--[acetyl-CoA-carboxylase] ligase [Victivallales bacterium]
MPSVILLNEVDSTNLYALRNIHKLENLSVIFAEYQSAGKGRENRNWFSPKGNIYASFVLKEFKYPPPCAAFATCLAGLFTLRSLAPSINLSIKLPNDIVCENRKIGGVLCEFRKVQNKDIIVAGIGLNINSSEDELKNIPANAVSIYSITKEKNDLEFVRISLINNAYRFFSMSDDEIVSNFVKNCIMSGREVVVKDYQFHIKGKLNEILKDGAAIIETPDGKIRKFYSGDFSSDS